MKTNIIYNEDCLGEKGMRILPEKSIDLTVTSPPYDNLRTYGGFIFDFKSIAKELYRVTKDGGVVVWVVGDETKDFCESLSSFKQVLFFKGIGFNLLDTMIYYKQNYAPAYPTLRRYANQFEYMFVFSKGKPKTFNPIQKERVRNKQEKVGFRQKNGSWIKKEVGLKKSTKDASNVWEYGGWDKNIGHPAPFPEQLAQDHILSWSNENNIVLDPMFGSGTTLKMAKKLNRKYIGFEISKEYYEIAQQRLEAEKTLWD